MRNRIGKKIWALWMFSFFWIFAQAQAQLQEVSVRAVVENDEVFAGESFIFQIQIEGDDNPETPDITSLKSFRVEFQGGQKNNSESVTIINGRMSRVVQRGYFFSYRLMASKAGRQIIPSLEVLVKGQKISTSPITIYVKEPQETSDYKLSCSLSTENCYVGQPIILSVVWYIGKNTQNIRFTMPVLEDERFYKDSIEVVRSPAKEYYNLEIGGENIVAEKGSGVLDGKDYMTIQFRKVLIPKVAGVCEIPPATVMCEGLTGYKKNDRRDFFSDFFNDDVFGRKGVYKKFVVPSNALRIKVLSLPEEGKPVNFSGYIGTYSLEARAKPTEVNVGDPITLTLAISGSEYLKHIEPPDLQKQTSLSQNFKIPKEIASGEIQGKTKVFTQTIRAMHENVKEIPPIEISYFDPVNAKYSVARSRSIPLLVRSTKILTSKDAEGNDVSTEKSDVKGFAEGIAYNYEDMTVLENQEYGLQTLGGIGWILAAFLPLGVYIALLGFTYFSRKSQSDPLSREAKRAYSVFCRATKSIQKSRLSSSSFYPALLDAIRQYLGSKLRTTGGSLTYLDVERLLSKSNLENELLKEIRNIFEECEAGCYAKGMEGDKDFSQIVHRAVNLIKNLEKKLP